MLLSDYRVLTKAVGEPISPTASTSVDDEAQRNQLCSMLAGCSRLISPAPWKSSFYGALSEVSFILRTLELFDEGAYSPQNSLGPVTNIFNLDRTAGSEESPVDSSHGLPEKELTLQLTRLALDHFHALIDFLHEAHFRRMIDLVYEQGSAKTDAYIRFAPLLHQVIALGYLVSRNLHQDLGCVTAVDVAKKHFRIGQQLIDISRCDDLVSLQALLCGAAFLMSTSRIAAAHALVGLAASSAIRVGLYGATASQTEMPQEEREMRVLVLAAFIKLDLYVSLILDLPRFVQEDSVEACLHDLDEVFKHRTQLEFSHKASIKHLELLRSSYTARQAIFVDATTGESIQAIDSTRLAAAEAELHRWTREVSAMLFPHGHRPEFAL